MEKEEAMTTWTADESPAPLDQRARDRRFAAILLAGLTAVFISSVLFNPSEVQPDGQYFTICVFKRLTGMPCPGCGLTHSFCALGHGDLKAGFAFNLLGPPLFVCAALLWLRSAFFIFGWDGPVGVLDRLGAWFKPVKMFLLAFLVFGVARIFYLLIDNPSLLTESSLFKLMAGFLN
jgi:hypothetical protein